MYLRERKSWCRGLETQDGELRRQLGSTAAPDMGGRKQRGASVGRKTKGEDDAASPPLVAAAFHLWRVLHSIVEGGVDLFGEDQEALSILADAITSLSGSMLFVYLHILWFGAWLLVNTGHMGIKPFDPFPYGLLTMIVSLEAIFLSTFVLISQNRFSDAADRRAELSLQIGLLAEHEITRVLQMLDESHLLRQERRWREISLLRVPPCPKARLGRLPDQKYLRR